MKLSEYILKPREERIAHIDKLTDCILGNTNARNRAKKALLEKLSLEDDVGNWKIGKIELCHLCPCGSNNGWCENPEHLYIGTKSENSLDRTPESRIEVAKTASRAANAEKNEKGQSVTAVKASEAAHAEKNEKGQSVVSVKGGEASLEKCGKPVMLTETDSGKTHLFPSIREAARGLNLNRRGLSFVLSGVQKTHKGFTAQFI